MVWTDSRDEDFGSLGQLDEILLIELRNLNGWLLAIRVDLAKLVGNGLQLAF